MFSRKSRRPEVGLIFLEMWVEAPDFPPPTIEESARAAMIIEHFKAGASSCRYASFDKVANRPNGKVIFVWAKDGIVLAMNVAREVAIRLSEEIPGVLLLTGEGNLPHHVWVPTQD